MTNEQEWRDRLFKEIDMLREDVKDIKNEMTTLKIKVAGFASLVGALVTGIVNKFFH